MILIISEKYDGQTDLVMDWLKHYNYPVLRINNQDKIFIEKIEIGNDTTNYLLKIKSDIGKVGFVDSKLIECVWYRRGDFTLPSLFSEEEINKSAFVKTLKDFNKSTNDDLRKFFHNLFLEKQIGNFYDNTTNKLLNLDQAKKLGLQIPVTIITTQKTKVRDFLNAHSRIITKGINTNGLDLKGGMNCTCLTKEITEQNIQDLPDSFPPSLFQKLINKILEIRVFYLNGECFSVAMLTQSNTKTQLDFRNYDDQRPTRKIPFQIPTHIAVKIKAFMNKVQMKTGSIDLMVDDKAEIYFLEVNPVGQFGFISNWCNENLEQKVALELIKISNGRA